MIRDPILRVTLAVALYCLAVVGGLCGVLAIQAHPHYTGILLFTGSAISAVMGSWLLRVR